MRVVKEVSSQVLYLRFLEPTSRGHPNCFRVEWGSLCTVENNKCREMVVTRTKTPRDKVLHLLKML